MKTQKQIKAFLLKTLLPYRKDHKNCAVANKSCKYITRDGKKCAVGVWMKKGDWQHEQKIVGELFNKYDPKDILLKPARDMDFSVNQWGYIQEYHDTIGFGHTTGQVNSVVDDLEVSFGIKLPELRF